MTPKEIKTLIKTLRESGVTHYKSKDLELNLTPILEVVPRETIKPKAKVSVENGEDESKEIIHKVEELTSLLKLSDKDLVDRLFPDHTDYGDDEEPIAISS